jgi:hypothetical protein
MIALSACSSSRELSKNTGNEKVSDHAIIPGPPALVYKTRGDYNNLVPVLLSDDNTIIVSYPHPDDLKTSNGYRVPVVLKRGYLLDIKGIGKNVAFLSITYEEYAKFQVPPSLEELEKLILDRDPLLELYDCGNITSYKEPKNQLNNLIKHNKLGTCKRIK